jgi:hypothetical protein
VGGTAPLLSARRGAALAALLACVAGWVWLAPELPALSDNGDVALAAVVLIPATLSVAWLALPLARMRHLSAVTAVAGLVAAALELAGPDALANAAKLFACVLVGYWFLGVFVELWLLVVVALIIPWVDAVSVAAGPTRVVVEERPDLLERISIAFPLPGEHASANLGPPDVIFLALFLSAAERYGLRVAATFLTTIVLLGVTLALAVAFDLGGLPALPAVSLGFLLPNADLLWRRRSETGLGTADEPETQPQ